MKFKVGDKVKIVRNTLNSLNNVGDNGIVTQIASTSKPSYRVTVKGGANGGNFHYEEDLILSDSLPINITFKNKYEHQVVQRFLFDNGCSWCCSQEKINPKDFGNNAIQVMAGRQLSNYCQPDIIDSDTDYPTFTINDLETIKEILNPSKPITEFKLNDRYTAIIDPNTSIVKVGCQSFTFDEIKELTGKL